MNEPGITLEQLIAYLSGELDPDEHAIVEAQVAHRPDVMAELSRIRSLLNDLRNDDSEAPPEGVLRRVTAMMGGPAPPAASWFDDAVRLVATLIYDSRTPAALVGARGSSLDYHLAYEGAPGRADLQVSALDRRGAQWSVRAQVTTGDVAPAGPMCLVRPETGAVVTTTGAYEPGRFRMTASPGTYEVRIGLSDERQLLVLPDVELG